MAIRKTLQMLYPFVTLLIGIVIAQILATIHVYLSNSGLHASLTAIKDAGYLTVPNQQIMTHLHELATALSGGLFFTFSIGAGLSVFSMALAWIWDRLFDRQKYLLYLYLALWFASLITLNLRGFSPMATAYFIIIPPIVFFVSLKWMPPLEKQFNWLLRLGHLIPVIILAILLSWQIDNRLFTDFRDIFLLSNPVGSKINRFYYTYTLYPAEAFKSLGQKMLKTCKLGKIKDTAKARSLEDILIIYDYISVSGSKDVDLKVIQVNDDLVFEHKGNSILRMASEDFFSDPGAVIKEFAQKTDRHAFFRQITFLFLLTGFPLAIYILLHGLISLVCNLFLNLRVSTIFASLLCFGLSLSLMILFQLNRNPRLAVNNLTEALNADSWQMRVAALKIIDEKRLKINRFAAYPKLLASPHLPERYWFVRTLANSRSAITYRDLLTFLEDPHPNVQSMAFYALGKRGNRQAVDEIIKKIKTANNWYSQWYAYRALRALGWKQTKLN
jgi:hypothetical protein